MTGGSNMPSDFNKKSRLLSNPDLSVFAKDIFALQKSSPEFDKRTYAINIKSMRILIEEEGIESIEEKLQNKNITLVHRSKDKNNKEVFSFGSTTFSSETVNSSNEDEELSDSAQLEKDIGEGNEKITEFNNEKIIIHLQEMDETGQIIVRRLDPNKVTIKIMNNGEYERFYNATYSSFKDLANFYKNLNEVNENIKINPQNLQYNYPLTGKVRDIGQPIKTKKTNHKEKDDRRISFRENAKEIILMAKAKARKKKEQEKAILKTHDKLFQIQTINRNRNEALGFPENVKIIRAHEVPRNT